MMFWRYMLCDKGYGPVTKRKNFPHREYFGKKRFYVLLKTDSKNNGKNIRVEQTKKQQKKQNCSIQHGDDCQTKIDSYLDSFFVPLITQTVCVTVVASHV